MDGIIGPIWACIWCITHDPSAHINALVLCDGVFEHVAVNYLLIYWKPHTTSVVIDSTLLFHFTQWTIMALINTPIILMRLHWWCRYRRCRYFSSSLLGFDMSSGGGFRICGRSSYEPISSNRISISPPRCKCQHANDGIKYIPYLWARLCDRWIHINDESIQHAAITRFRTEN